MSTNAWPMFLQNGRHTGLSSQVGPVTAEPAWSFQAPAPIVTGVAVAEDGMVCFGCEDNRLYCLNPDRTLRWTFESGAPLTAVTPAIGGDGTVYVGSDQLYAIGATGQLKWVYRQGGTITTSPVLGGDGTVYAAATSRASPPVHQLLALSPAGELKWAFALGGASRSTPAVGADGTIFLGCDDHMLYAVTSNGTLRWRADAGGPVCSAPVIGEDGTIYCVARPGGARHRLIAFSPDGTLRWQRDYDGDATTPALGPDGTIYLAYRAFRLEALAADGSQKWAATAGCPEVTPGAPAVAADGSVYFATAAGTVFAYNGDGTPRWTVGGGPEYAAPAIGPEGSVYIGGLNRSLTAIEGPLTPALQALYNRLRAARRAVPESARYIYPLNAETLGERALSNLIAANLGVQELQVAGDDLALTVNSRRLQLAGTATFLHHEATPVSITFGEQNGRLTLDLVALPPDGWSFGRAFAILAGTIVDEISLKVRSPAFFLSSAGFADSARGIQVPAGLSFWGQTALEGPLGQLARLVGDPGQVPVFGPITFEKDLPILQLQVGETYTIAPAPRCTVTARALLRTYYDAELETLGTEIQLVGTLPMDEARTLTVTGSVPPVPGLVEIAGRFDPPWDAGLSVLKLWDGQEDLTEYLPQQLKGRRCFGISTISLTFSTATAQCVSLDCEVTAPEWHALEDLITVRNVVLRLSVFSPFAASKRQFLARLRGDFTLTLANRPATFAVEATYPDFTVTAELTSGSIDPAAIVTSFVGATLPEGMPTVAFDEVSLTAYPSLGRVNYYMRSDSFLPIPVGIEGLGLTGLGLTLDRIQTAPGGSYKWTCALFGIVAVAGSEFQLCAWSPDSGNDWQFQVQLAEELPLPSIKQIVGFLNPSWSEALPAAISDLGQNIVLRQLDAAISPGTTELAVTLGSPKDWSGWQVISEPVSVCIDSAEVSVSLAPGRSPTGAVRGTFLLGDKPIALVAPLPFNSGAFTLKLDADRQGIDLPSVGQLVGFVNPTWADAMPEFIKGLGSGIRLQCFAVTVSQEETRVVVDVAAAPETAPWNLITAPVTIGVVDLRVGVSATRKGGATTFAGAIRGSVRVGDRSIPLKAPFSDNLQSFKLELETAKLKPRTDKSELETDDRDPLPTVSDIVSLISRDWVQALPEAIVRLGSSISLRVFSLEVSPQEKKLAVEVGTLQDFGWKPLPSLNLTIEQATVRLDVRQPSAGEPELSGTLQGDLTLLGQSVQLTMALQSPTPALPRSRLTGRIDTPNFNLKKLVELFFGPSALIPDFLAIVGFRATEVAISFQSPAHLTLCAVVAEGVAVPGGGKLRKLCLAAVYNEDSGPRICLVGEWEITEKTVLSGELCFPFKEWITPEGKRIPFPPPSAPTPPPDDPTPPPDDPTPPSNDRPIVIDLARDLLLRGAPVVGVAVFMARYRVGPRLVVTVLREAGVQIADAARSLVNAFSLGNRLELLASYLRAGFGSAGPSEILEGIRAACPALTARQAIVALGAVFVVPVEMMASALAKHYPLPRPQTPCTPSIRVTRTRRARRPRC